MTGVKRQAKRALSDEELLVQWAAEEFVASGRAAERELQEEHRRRATFFADISHAMRTTAQPAAPQPNLEEIGRLLAVAFGRTPPRG
jgi:hypothetical protein